MDIIHLDMDAFYASVEVLDNPALLGQAVVVGGGFSRGVVSAASYEARRFGVHSAMPMALARQRCPQAVFLPVRMDRYREVSARIHAIFHRFTPLVEALSLDEAFLDVTDSRALFGPPATIAARIKEAVRQETRLTCSAGVASAKLVAKIASDLDKPDGLTVVARGHEREFLSPLAIERLWGVGKQTRESLRLMGVKTIGDLSRLPEKVLCDKFGKAGRHLHQAALGIDPRPVVPERPVQSVGHEETFGVDLTDPDAIRRELLALAVRVARRLRRYQLHGRTVTVKVKYHDFVQRSRSITLDHATDDTRTLYRAALGLLHKTEAGTRPVRLLGLTVDNLRSGSSPRQQPLFCQPEHLAPQPELNRAMDAIAAKYGSHAVVPATLLEDAQGE